MTTFLQNLQRGTNLTTTENGAVTNASSLNAVVDFFGLAGAMRNTPEKAAELFENAYHEDPLTAIRTLFYLRDIRGGQGERDVFRHGLARLRHIDQRTFDQIVEHVPEYGRWDDLFSRGVIDPRVMTMVKQQLFGDQASRLNGKPVSLLAKWLPSENATSKETKAQAKFIRTQLGFTPRVYRIILSQLRAQIRLLEQDMSRNNWNEIDYGKLPGQAHRRHVKAFQRHTPDRYQSYLDSVQKGEAKINVSNVYPYEIYNMVTKREFEYANVAWENLPDYTTGENALVMADVSGSMSRPYQPNNPIAVSVSLALYFAERNKGAFKDYFMTFSAQPQLVKVTGSNLAERMAHISHAHWEQNTNLLAAFRAILQAAKTDPENTPKVLYVISDMEFDQAQPMRGQYKIVQSPVWPHSVRQVFVQDPATSQDTLFEIAKAEFSAAGLTLPHVVFWNVQARNMQTPAVANDGNVTLVSGLSPTVFGMAVQGKTPLELVYEVVNSERYGRIVI
jgi:hypothetical protein